MFSELIAIKLFSSYRYYTFKRLAKRTVCDSPVSVFQTVIQVNTSYTCMNYNNSVKTSHKLRKSKNSNGISVLPWMYTEFATKNWLFGNPNLYPTAVQVDFLFCLRNVWILCSKTGGFVTEELGRAILSSPRSIRWPLNTFPEFSLHINCKFKLHWPVASIK